MEKDIKYMDIALNEAISAYKEDEVPIGCIIVKDDIIIAKAHNQKEKTYNPLAHAEMEAILKAVENEKIRYLNNCTLYVTLEPCLMCAGAIINTRISRVVFAAKDPKGGSLVSNISLLNIKGYNHYPQIEYGIKEKESADLLKKFFQEKRKNKN